MEITLEELVQEVGIPVARLDATCSDEHLNKISLFLDWRVTAPQLGLEGVEVRAIDEREKTEREKRLKTLQKWRGKYGSRATYKMLVEVLLSINLADQAEEVCHLLVAAKQGNSQHFLRMHEHLWIPEQIELGIQMSSITQFEGMRS